MRHLLQYGYHASDATMALSFGLPGAINATFSQGETIEELEENIRDAYELMLETEPTLTKITEMERRLPFPSMTKSRIACVI